MNIINLDGNLLKKAITQGAWVLRNNKKTVDALNVFPVPDGDTGTNMSLTMDQAAEEVNKLKKSDLKSVADAAAWGSLMGARGNSGVILSQLFRGFSLYISSDKESLNASEIAQAFKSGVDAAYRAVMRPVEGTILTVARETAERMIAESKKEKDMIAVLQKGIDHAEKILSKTPEMLKALRDAKVVDAGGKGLIFIMKGFLQALEQPEADFVEIPLESDTNVETVYQESTEDIKYKYCTELFITAKQIDLEAIRGKLSTLGDSLIVIGMDDLVKIHVHTNHPGEVIEETLKWGELSKIKVDNMKLQHREIIEEVKEENKEPKQEAQNEVPVYVDNDESDIGVIAVAQGQGLQKIFKSLGADVIEGGQTMNPSTENILSAIEKAPHNNIIILPNNKNIIMTAQQTKHLTKKNVIVLPTKTIPQGIAALLTFNPAASVEENEENMGASINGVITGEVTYAVRQSEWNGKDIQQGDILGIIDGKLTEVNKNTEEVLMDLIERMTEDKDGGIITIYYGVDINESIMEDIAKKLTEKYKDFDVEYYSGGQNLYYYIVSVE